MIANLVGYIARSLVEASVNRDAPAGATRKRAYYNWVILTIAVIPLLLFGFFFVGGAVNMANGFSNGLGIMLIGLVMTVGWGCLIAFQILGREVVWDEKGLKFRWFRNEANLAWTDIEKVEMRPHRRDHARIRFRDGRTFVVSSKFSGCNALLRDIAVRGIPFHTWGTSEPLPAKGF